MQLRQPQYVLSCILGPDLLSFCTSSAQLQVLSTVDEAPYLQVEETINVSREKNADAVIQRLKLYGSLPAAECRYILCPNQSLLVWFATTLPLSRNHKC